MNSKWKGRLEFMFPTLTKFQKMLVSYELIIYGYD